MYQEIATAVTSAKGLIDLVRASSDLRNRTDIAAAIAAVQDSLLAAQGKALQAQEKNAELASEVQRLKDELATVQSWAERSSNYELITTGGGAIVYRSRQAPHHFVCPSCLERREIQILQDRRVWSGLFECPACKVHYPVKPESRAATPAYARSDDNDRYF